MFKRFLEIVLNYSEPLNRYNLFRIKFSLAFSWNSRTVVRLNHQYQQKLIRLLNFLAFKLTVYWQYSDSKMSHVNPEICCRWNWHSRKTNLKCWCDWWLKDIWLDQIASFCKRSLDFVENWKFLTLSLKEFTLKPSKNLKEIVKKDPESFSYNVIKTTPKIIRLLAFLYALIEE